LASDVDHQPLVVADQRVRLHDAITLGVMGRPTDLEVVGPRYLTGDQGHALHHEGRARRLDQLQTCIPYPLARQWYQAVDLAIRIDNGTLQIGIRVQCQGKTEASQATVQAD